MTAALAVLCALLALVAIGLGVLVARQRRELDAQRAHVEQLEADLSTALKPRPARTPAERVVRRVVRTAGRTAVRVRSGGLAGLLQGSIEDLQTWADTERDEIANLADSDGVVTLFFSDIEDSTGLNERLGDDAWVRVLAAHDELLRRRIDTYRGQVVKTAGDGFMVAFRDAEAACRAAVGIQKDLRRTLDPKLRGTVRVRIGIHTGTVVSRQGDYFGRNVAMAARVGDLATGGEVLVTDAVREALDEDAAVELVEMGEVELRGLPETHVVHRVVVPR